MDFSFQGRDILLHYIVLCSFLLCVLYLFILNKIRVSTFLFFLSIKLIHFHSYIDYCCYQPVSMGARSQFF